MPTASDLFAAIDGDHADDVESLLRESPGLASARDDDGVSTVLHALYRGRRALAERLAAALPELDVFDAAALGRAERIRELLAVDRTSRASPATSTWSRGSADPDTRLGPIAYAPPCRTVLVATQSLDRRAPRGERHERRRTTPKSRRHARRRPGRCRGVPAPRARGIGRRAPWHRRSGCSTSASERVGRA